MQKKIKHILAENGKLLSYREEEVVLLEDNDCLKHLPILCVWARNSLSDIFSHFLLNFALIRCSSRINFGSLFSISNLFGGRYFNHRISLLPVDSNNFQFRFYFNHMFKIPTNQDGNIIDRRYGDMQSIGKIFFRYNFGVDIILGKLSCFFGNGKKLYLVFFDNAFKEYLFRFLRRLFDFLYSYFRAIEVVIKQAGILKESRCENFHFRILSVQPVYDRSINIYPHACDYTIGKEERQGKMEDTL